MKKRTKAVLTIFFLSLLFFVEINVEARSVRNMSAYPAKHGQSFVQSVWMEQKEVFDASLYQAVLCTKDMKQKKSRKFFTTIYTITTMAHRSSFMGHVQCLGDSRYYRGSEEKSLVSSDADGDHTFGRWKKQDSDE